MYCAEVGEGNSSCSKPSSESASSGMDVSFSGGGDRSCEAVEVRGSSMRDGWMVAIVWLNVCVSVDDNDVVVELGF